MYNVFTTWRNWTKKRQQKFDGEKADNVLDSLAGFSLIFVNSLWWGQPGQLRCVRGAGRRPPPFSSRPPGQARPLRCAGVGVCRYHGKGALGGHILPQGGSALGIREGG